MAERTGNGGHGLVKGATVFGLAVPMIVIVPLVMLMSLSTILVAMVQAQYGTTCGVVERVRNNDLMGRMGEEHRRRFPRLQSDAS